MPSHRRERWMAPSIETSAEPNLEQIAPRAAITTFKCLLHHSLVTKNSEALQFHAAAALQLRFGSLSDNIVKLDDRLIASPYNEPPHLLDLKTLDTPDRLLAKALTVLKPIRDDYATAPYAESFNWQEVVDLLPKFPDADGYPWQRQEFYVVVFRSRLRPDANFQLLQVLDIHSHREATASGGLLKYWFGNRNENHENLATCIWRSREDACLGGTGPWHKQAVTAARDLYERVIFNNFALVIQDGKLGISDGRESSEKWFTVTEAK